MCDSVTPPSHTPFLRGTIEPNREWRQGMVHIMTVLQQVANVPVAANYRYDSLTPLFPLWCVIRPEPLAPDRTHRRVSQTRKHPKASRQAANHTLLGGFRIV
jgi:hypothetical protein